MSAAFQRHFVQSLLQKFGHFQFHFQSCFEFSLSLVGRLKCGWQHVGKEFEEDGQCKFHEGNDNENGKRDETENVRSCGDELFLFTTRQGLSLKYTYEQIPRNSHLNEQQSKAMIVMDQLV